MFAMKSIFGKNMKEENLHEARLGFDKFMVEMKENMHKIENDSEFLKNLLSQKDDFFQDEKTSNQEIGFINSNDSQAQTLLTPGEDQL